MQLLDAILAFALTMAALATVVTVTMEVVLRIARMRKKNFIEVMKLLNKELESGPLKMSPEDRWDFFVKAVRNPAETAVGELKKKANDLLAGEETDEGKNQVVATAIATLGREKAAIYAGVSLEYMLRCLANTSSVRKSLKKAKEDLEAAKDTLKIKFNRIATKYEEFGSSVSASFKNCSQRWSIIIGIFLAFAANIDGWRIFEAYQADPKLAVAVIEKQDEYFKTYEKARVSLEKVQNDNSQGQATIEEIDKTIKAAQSHITDLTTLGVPIGWDFYPNCPYDGDKSKWSRSSPKCRSLPDEVKEYKSGCIFPRVWKTVSNDKSGFAIWLFIVLISGVLIGLGAPFWFDVAKRLSAIRKGLRNPAASSEYRLSGMNADGDSKKRMEIVANVLEEAASEAAIDSK